MSYLYLTTSDVKLGFRENQIVVSRGEREDGRNLPIEEIDGISVFGYAQLSTQLVRACISRNIPIGYYSNDGHYFGSLGSSTGIDPVRQKKQVYLTDNAEFCLEWSKSIVSAKIENSLMLLRSSRDIYDFDEGDFQGMLHSLEYLKYADSVDMVLGFEGNAARNYFACLPKLLRNDGFAFAGRSSRPPKDPFNSMLSFGYSIFYRNIIGAIERHGLHPYFAFMHKLRLGHAALASDLIEEYRAPLVDKIVLDMVNDGEVDVSDFYRNNSGAIYMKRDTAGKLTNRLSEIISKNQEYFYDSGDRKLYGFQVMLDKKILLLIEAIEKQDARIYRPYLWHSEDL